jgi:two-component system response regulator MprA
MERAPPTPAPTILIIDDDPDIRDMLALVLNGEGYRTIVAMDGLDGLVVAAFMRPDLILLDLAMPRLDGSGFCRTYRERGGGAPIVLITAAQPAAVHVAVEACGAVAFVAKPFGIDEILDAVARHLPAANG